MTVIHSDKLTIIHIDVDSQWEQGLVAQAQRIAELEQELAAIKKQKPVGNVLSVHHGDDGSAVLTVMWNKKSMNFWELGVNSGGTLFAAPVAPAQPVNELVEAHSGAFTQGWPSAEQREVANLANTGSKTSETRMDIASDHGGVQQQLTPEQPKGERAELIQKMVNRFLGWKLPREFSPDAGITFKLPRYEGFSLPSCWPVGTNLFTADQAKAMFEHCLGDAKAAQQLTPEQTKPNCKECAKWVQEQSDNKDWIDGVARGKKIIEQLAAQEIMKGAQ